MTKVDRLVNELNRSGNVEAVNEVDRTESKDKVTTGYEYVTLSITLKPEGYNFNLIQEKYPDFKVRDVHSTDDKLKIVAQIHEVRE